MQRWFFLENDENACIRARGEGDDLGLPAGPLINMSERQEWLFQVRVPDLRPGEVVCVSGNCKELGEWCVDRCIQLIEVSSGNFWSKVVSIPVHEDVEYRYAVCTIIAPCPHVLVRRWETNLNPRLINKNVERTTVQSEPEEFGYYDGCTRIERGWLSRDTVVQFKLFNNPIQIWKPKIAGRKIFVKVTPVSLFKHQNDLGLAEAFEESLSMDTQEFVQPPAHTISEVACLTSEDGSFQLQQQFGIPYNEGDYLIFQTSVLQPQNVAYLIDLYVYSTKALENEPPYHLGFSYILASALKNSEGQMILPITSVKQRPLGQLNLEYLIVHPLKDIVCDLKVSFARHWKQSWAGLDVAHRGLGSNFVDTKRCAEVRENTIASLKTAISHGADFVEFDVQLSKDLVPVIYHDFHIFISMKRKKYVDETELLELPVKDLTLDQLHLLKVYHLEEGKDKNPRFFDEHLEEHQPFPTLRHVLEVLDPHVGFNIEIKWTMQLKDGSFELNHPIELNVYLDRILNVVMRYGNQRRIIFSSFNPDLCTMIRLKQNKYPVMFLTQGQTVRYPSYHDTRCRSIEAAVQFATTMGLLGVSVHSEDILRDGSQVKLALDAGLVIFCWGNDNNDPNTIKHLKQIGLHGVIYDKINEFSSKEVKESIFLIEARESQRNKFIELAEINAHPTTPTAPIPPFEQAIDMERARLTLGSPSTATSLDSLEGLDGFTNQVQMVPKDDNVSCRLHGTAPKATTSDPSEIPPPLA